MFGGIFLHYHLALFPEQEVMEITYSDTYFQDRVYLQNKNLIGDETIIEYSNGKRVDYKITPGMITNFSTKVLGEHVAEITHANKSRKYTYYVVSSADDTSLNGIIYVNDFTQTYYVNEPLNVEDAEIGFREIKGGYVCTEDIPLTESMISGFDSSTTGTKKLTVTYKNYTYSIPYYVVEKLTGPVTSDVFESNKIYYGNTVETTEHFRIEISGGSIIHSNYKTIIEEIYDAMCLVMGVTTTDTIIIQVDNKLFPSCGEHTIYINSYDFCVLDVGAFVHELAHAVIHSQVGTVNPLNAVVSEGLAKYVEYLTAKYLEQNNYYVSSLAITSTCVLNDVQFLGSDLYLYDFEKDVMFWERDEVVPNSQYEAGARFFAYLHKRYKDFCGWLKYPEFEDLETQDFIDLLKHYYNNPNVFAEFVPFEQMMAKTFVGFCTNTEVADLFLIDSDLSRVKYFNFVFDLYCAEMFRGDREFVYKDTYLNIDSAREQLTGLNIPFTEITLRTSKNVELELYSADGTLLNTIQNPSVEFELEGVSFIKFVGYGNVRCYFDF